MKGGLLDLVIMPESTQALIKGFQWTELRRLALVLVMAPTHPLAKLTKIPPKRLNGLPLHGLGRVNFPDYVPRMRALLKPFGVVLDFATLSNDGVTTMFASLEATNGATILADGVVSVLPRTLEVRPFSPALPDIVILAGLPADRSSPHAETFVRLLRAEVARPTGKA